MKLVLFVLLVLGMPFIGVAYEGYTSFCSSVKNWPKKAEIVKPDSSKDSFAKESNLNKVMNSIDIQKAKGKHNSKNFVFVDARKKSDRKVGQIPFAIKITGNSSDTKKKGSANQFSTKKLLKEINKLAKKIRRKNKKSTEKLDLGLKDSYESINDLKNLNFIVFCNGRKCHRSTWGGCELLRLGIDPSKVHIMLEGFPGWKAGNGVIN